MGMDAEGTKALGRGKAIGALGSLTLSLHDSCHVVIALSDKKLRCSGCMQKREGDKRKKG